MAITITRGGGATSFATTLELDLYAGSPEDGTLWQGSDYPGALTAFAANNTDRTNVAGLKLLCGELGVADYKAAAISLQVSGEATQIVAYMLGSAGTLDHSTTGLGSGVRGALSDTGTTGVNNTLTLTYPGGISDVTVAATQIWMICG